MINFEWNNYQSVKQMYHFPKAKTQKISSFWCKQGKAL